MKPYTQPVTETIVIQSVEFFMALAGSGDHGMKSAPRRKVF